LEMASREEVYSECGKAAEVAQRLETRDLLTHRCYRPHGFASLEDAGRSTQSLGPTPYTSDINLHRK
jgi:hypothetical protein